MLSSFASGHEVNLAYMYSEMLAKMLPRNGVWLLDGVWNCNQIYWTLTELTVFISRCLVVATNREHPLPLSSPTVPGLMYYLLASHNKRQLKVKFKLRLRQSAPSGAYYQIFISVRQLRVSWCGVLSLKRKQACCSQLLLVLVSAVILGSESCGTRDQILLSQIKDSLNLEGQVPVFTSPSYTPRHWVPFSSPRTVRRATVEVFDPASTPSRWIISLCVIITAMFRVLQLLVRTTRECPINWFTNRNPV
jgi:hypothetical protein